MPAALQSPAPSLSAPWVPRAGLDWSGHPLGAPATWPEALRSLVRTMERCQGPMFVCWGPQSHLLYNERYAEILCDKHPAAYGRPFRQVWPEVGAELDDMLARVQAGEGLHGVNVPFDVRRNGRDETAYFSFNWNPVLDEGGRVQGFFCTAIETTATLVAERAREEQSARLLQLFEQAPGFLAVLEGPGHVFRHANPAYQAFVGRRDIVGRPVREVAPEAIAQGWGRVLDDVYRTGQPFIGDGAPVLLRREEGGAAQEMSVNFVFQPVRDAAGTVTGILIQGYDVTAQARAQAALRESEAKFRAISDAIPQIVWTTRPDGWHEYYNRRWYAFTGAAEGDTDGIGWQQVLHPDDLDRTIATWQHSLDTGEPYEIEYRMRRHDGVYCWMLGLALPLRDDAGRIVRWMGTCTEIEEQVKSRESLREEDRRKDEFLAMLAHELRNPLAPITSSVALLRRVAGDEARVRSVTDIIGRQAAHMRGLVDDLLDVSRVTRGLITLQDDRVDLREVLAEALEQTRPLMETRRHAVATSLGGRALLTVGDRKRLVQVFANLLTNAAKYTPPGGRIAIGCRERAGSLAVTIEDSGQGMTPELIARAFELFAQGERTPDRREGGLGIGLALVRRLVELHGGAVTARSAGPGLGSTFEVVLARAAEPAEPAPTPVPARGAPLREARVLIVDANADAGSALAMFLEELGHAVRIEATGARALEAARTFAPDVCLLDTALPDLGGRELAQRLRALPGGGRMVLGALSGWSQPEDLAASDAAGMEHFTKPIDAEALARWIWKACEAPRPAA